MKCDCIKNTNELLKPYGAVVMSSLFGPPEACVETYTEKKIRGKRTPVLMASFCPFCGVKYERSAPPAASEDRT
jgi:hypothetical protein